jgi:hypothetical protein
MSTVTLVTVEGYGGQGIPRVAGTEKYVETGTWVSDDRDIMAVMRRDFEPAPDGPRQSSPSLDPVIRYERINDLMGKILTLVDASTADAAQRKAQKDLFKMVVWAWYEAQTASVRPSMNPGA